MAKNKYKEYEVKFELEEFFNKNPKVVAYLKDKFDTEEKQVGYIKEIAEEFRPGSTLDINDVLNCFVVGASAYVGHKAGSLCAAFLAVSVIPVSVPLAVTMVVGSLIGVAVGLTLGSNYFTKQQMKKSEDFVCKTLLKEAREHKHSKLVRSETPA